MSVPRRTGNGANEQHNSRRHDVPLVRTRFRKRRLLPAELFVGSFFVLTVLGTLSLKFLPGLYQGAPLGWLDAAFTATSAVCVTGLIVVDSATYFTFAGQLVILLLLQLGGLGMLVLTSFIIMALGRRPSLRTETLAAGSRHMIPHIPARELILDVVRFTFALESIGAVLLYGLWVPRLGWQEALWPAIFHSVSAFCNAGFSTNTLSLVEFHDSPATIFVISSLIIAGGLGFVTMEEIYLWLVHSKKAVRRISVHSRIVIAATVALIVSGWLLFAFFEWRGVLAEMSVIDKLSNSFFMSVTPRTAGFNTIDYGEATDSSNFLTILLMMIGGSPGSTAGGMKTTTFALLGLLAWSRLRSRPTTFAHRSIPDETIQRATGLFVIATGVVIVGVFALAIIGDVVGGNERFLVRLFEAASAFNTVGLSMGFTPHLSVASKCVIIFLMFVGRTGPLMIATALIIRFSRGGRFRLAYEDVVVG